MLSKIRYFIIFLLCFFACKNETNNDCDLKNVQKFSSLLQEKYTKNYMDIR